MLDTNLTAALVDPAPITAEIAANTLYYYSASDYPGVAIPISDWRRRLIALITKSDVINRKKIALAYPGQVAACCIIEWAPDGATTLLHIAADGKAFTCPKCQATSHNPNDLANGYCGRCHEFTGARTS